MSIDPNNPPKFVVMPFGLANEVWALLATLSYNRVSGLMARLDVETVPHDPAPPQPAKTTEELVEEVRADGLKNGGRAPTPVTHKGRSAT